MAKISYSSDELIEELKQDIADFGSDTMFAVWLRKYGKCEFVVNYDFVVAEEPISTDEIDDNERLIYMDGKSLLNRLEEQNRIL